MLPSIYILLHGDEIVVDLETYGDPCGILSLQLNPDNYQHATLKSIHRETPMSLYRTVSSATIMYYLQRDLKLPINK